MKRLFPLLLLLSVAACSESPVAFDPIGPPAKLLSQYNLFEWDPASGTFEYNERVIPYEMNTELFTDYALKARAIYVPEGLAGSFDAKDAFDFPVGTLILKNFYFPADFREPTEGLRLIETRLYVHTASGWEGRPYIWDAEGKDAEYKPGGEVRSVSFVDKQGVTRVANHLVPQQNQCQQCHVLKDPGTGANYQTIIGPKARHLNRTYDYGGEVGERNQLEYLAELGFLTGVPSDVDEVERAFDFRSIADAGHGALEPDELDKAARDYLDVNCAHCHNPNGVQGITSNLFLNYDNQDDFTLGICKPPGSAGQGAGGLTYDIVPGHPELSILNFRIETLMPGALMPLLGRSLEHVEATSLIADWVASLPAASCTP